MSSPEPDAAPRLAILTVSYGSSEVLPGFLESTARATVEPHLVVVADNKYDTASVASISSRFGATYLPLEQNLGYGGAVNRAALTLPPSVEWILISNPDVVLEAGAADILMRVGNEDTTIASVGPAILSSSGELYPSARSVPSLRIGIGHAFFVNLWGSNPWTRAYRNETTDFHTRREAGWLSGACVLVRRSVFDALHGFDSGYFMYFEDVDLGYRFGKAGFRNIYEPSAVVRHSGAHATETESEAMIATHHRSARRFLSQKYPGARLWPIRAVLTVGLAARSRLERWRVQRKA
jgi:N-acetylglucosaminyl-diphospho-decaprenol L-rhamnosyltransferase